MMLDSIVFAVVLFSVMTLSIGITDTTLRVIVIAIPLILFEPLMIWLTGGSVGHHFSGIRIVDKNSGENLFIFKAMIRYFTKLGLGIYSLVSMFLTQKHQAIHDLLSNSLVIFKNEEVALTQHKLEARKTVYNSGKPTIRRRIAVICLYLIIYLIIYSVVSGVFISDRCAYSNICTSSEDNLLTITGLVFTVAFLLILFLGSFAKLPGAYYAKSKDT